MILTAFGTSVKLRFSTIASLMDVAMSKAALSPSDCCRRKVETDNLGKVVPPQLRQWSGT